VQEADRARARSAYDMASESEVSEPVTCQTNLASDVGVLLAGSRRDPHIEYLVSELRKLDIPVTVLDVYEDRFAIHIDANGIRCPLLDELGRRHRLVVVMNRLKPPISEEDVACVGEPGTHRYWHSEWKTALEGLYAYVASVGDGFRLINAGSLLARAQNKCSQLATAAGAGFRIPRTIIGNDAEALAAQWPDQVLVKGLSGESFDSRGDAPVTILPGQKLSDLRVQIAWAPAIYQDCVEKAYELRVHVFGANVVAYLINSQSVPSARLDWRRNILRTEMFEEMSIPGSLRLKLHRFMCAMGLDAGVFDLAVTPDGEHIFFECNAGGQWAWLADRFGNQIPAAFAKMFADFRDGTISREGP
jgi:glutathione synthase/RimK-type ligase-like ATP-grasp enzyme